MLSWTLRIEIVSVHAFLLPAQLVIRVRYNVAQLIVNVKLYIKIITGKNET